MHYLVWDLISPYDGYHTHCCENWEEACKKVESRVRESSEQWPQLKTLYNKWKAGKISTIEHSVARHNGVVLDTVFEVFITTAPLTSEVPI